MFGLVKRINEQRAELEELKRLTESAREELRKQGRPWQARVQIMDLEREVDRLKSAVDKSKEAGAILACEKKCAELEAAVVDLRLRLAKRDDERESLMYTEVKP